MLEEGDGGVTINILAYADDLVLLAKDDDAMQLLLDTCAESANWCGLVFKPTKCATLHIDRRTRSSQPVLPTVFTIEEAEIRALKLGEHYKHLGVPIGFGNRQTPEEAVQNVVDKFHLQWDPQLQLRTRSPGVTHPPKPSWCIGRASATSSVRLRGPRSSAAYSASQIRGRSSRYRRSPQPLTT